MAKIDMKGFQAKKAELEKMPKAIRDEMERHQISAVEAKDRVVERLNRTGSCQGENEEN